MEFDESLLVQRFSATSMDKETGLRKIYHQQLTLHCSHCHTVLGDSCGICGEIQSLDSIVCLSVTTDIVVGGANDFGRKGEIANCIYRSLICRCCASLVGKVILSGPSCLSMIRSLFLLHKPDISCYILDSKSLVKAVTVTFDVKPLVPAINEVEKQFRAHLENFTHMSSRLMANNSGTYKLGQ
ncbi:protein Mis18-beta [Cynoglossus semilaevis]|uniref:Protein Mis18-beta-like n=1 Tax=Cynoglossus semilaevis TaxID=244447 RepID=A0A3P8VJU9_CYNSE|nr:protein Mis18-beta-like [Cynoglossus semilaevis]